ncbi:Gag-Pol polyprotein, partial [Plecturocebus cupreus]
MGFHHVGQAGLKLLTSGFLTLEGPPKAYVQVTGIAMLSMARSAQVTELVTLTQACQLGKDKAVNVYTDSRYAFGVTRKAGALKTDGVRGLYSNT